MIPRAALCGLNVVLLCAAATAQVQTSAAAADALQRLARLEARLAELQEQSDVLREAIDEHAALAPGADAPAAASARWLVVTDVDRARAAAATAGDAAGAERAAALRGELQGLETAVAAARRDAAERAAGDTSPRPEEAARLAPPPVARTTLPPPRQDAPATDEPLSIAGVADHTRVGTALVEAGLALLRQADGLQAEGRSEAAAELRRRGLSRLEAARAELAPVAATPSSSPLFALFALARCEEQLGQLAAADVRYRLIVERDPKGPYGSAARTARAVMRWIADTGDWRPRRDVDRIDWDAASPAQRPRRR